MFPTLQLWCEKADSSQISAAALQGGDDNERSLETLPLFLASLHVPQIPAPQLFPVTPLHIHCDAIHRGVWA